MSLKTKNNMFDNADVTRRYQTVEQQISRWKKKKNEYEQEHAVRNRTVNFVHCPHCESSIKRICLTDNTCPVCKESLLSQRTREHIEYLEAKIHALDEKRKTIERRYAKTNSTAEDGEETATWYYFHQYDTAGNLIAEAAAMCTTKEAAIEAADTRGWDEVVSLASECLWKRHRDH